ncbi:MAG: hypothetical protein H0W89_04120 [Candidatus Levybacteria bacterium]|nr:hypothetical protein [Candidatus Levybacteria bacterium]
MKKTKIKASKVTKARATKRKSSIGTALYATEHDFIIIAGGGLVVLMLTVFLFIQ